MELLFVVLGGWFVGGAAHASVANREHRGALLPVGVGGGAAAVAWAALVAAGIAPGAWWSWVAAFGAAAIASIAVAAVLGSRRAAAERAALGR